MASIFQPVLNEPGPSALSQGQPGVADPTLATAIEGIGNLATGAFKGIRTAQAKEDFRALVDDAEQNFITETGEELSARQRLEKLTSIDERQAQLIDPVRKQSPTVKAELESLNKQFNRLKNAKVQFMTQSQFRAAAESVLRQHIAATPGLAPEFRQAASEVLGFDPTGGILNDAFAARQLEQERATKANEALIDFAKDSLKIADAELLPREQLMERINERYEPWAAANEFEFRTSTLEANGAYTATQQKQMLPVAIRAQPSSVLTFLQSKGIDITNKKVLSPDEVARVRSLRATYMSQLRSKFTGLSAEERGPLIDIVNTLFDTVELFNESYSNDTETISDIILNQDTLSVMRTGPGRKLAVLANMIKGTQIPLSASIQIGRLQRDLADIIGEDGFLAPSIIGNNKNFNLSTGYLNSTGRHIEGDSEQASRAWTTWEGGFTNLFRNTINTGSEARKVQFFSKFDPKVYEAIKERSPVLYQSVNEAATEAYQVYEQDFRERFHSTLDDVATNLQIPIERLASSIGLSDAGQITVSSSANLTPAQRSDVRRALRDEFQTGAFLKGFAAAGAEDVENFSQLQERFFREAVVPVIDPQQRRPDVQGASPGIVRPPGTISGDTQPPGPRREDGSLTEALTGRKPISEMTLRDAENQLDFVRNFDVANISGLNPAGQKENLVEFWQEQVNKKKEQAGATATIKAVPPPVERLRDNPKLMQQILAADSQEEKTQLLIENGFNQMEIDELIQQGGSEIRRVGE